MTQTADRSTDSKPVERPPAGAALRVVGTRVYRGPNYWASSPAINLTVDLGALEEWPTSRLPGFTDALLELLPGIHDHHCSLGRPGGFVERLVDGTWLGHVAEHVAIELQRQTGADVRRGKTRGTGTTGEYFVIYHYADETVGLEAGRLAVRLVNHLVTPDPELDVTAEIESLIRLANRKAFGPSTQAILDEATMRDIPWLRLDAGSLVQLGQGVHQKRIRATITSQTSSLAVETAGDKDLTNRMLASAGLPVPRGESVRREEDAVRAARRIGFPVVVKPLDGNHGRGVMLDLPDEAAVREAFAVAKAQSRHGWVLVETYLTGRDYRLLVVGGRLVAAAERVPAHVYGDGVRTVAELVEQANADPRRGIGHEKELTRIKVDAAAVELVRAQGFEMDDVPPRDTMVKLALTGNMSTGGIAIDRTYVVHPDNAEIAELAAQVIGLDVAGIDFVTPDITRSAREDRGGIVEVNAAPGFRMHTHPTVGEPQFPAKAVVDELFPPGTPSRIPIVAVTGTNGKTTTTRMLAHVMKGVGKKVGMTSTDGIVVDGRLVYRADASGPKSARMILQNPRVDFAVFEVARGGILREGLGFERNDVAVVLNVSADHMGLAGITTLDQLADVKQVVVEAVPRGGTAVLNADDHRVLRMKRACKGDVILFSMQPDNPAIDAHCGRGGRAVVVEGVNGAETIRIRQGRRMLDVVRTEAIPATFGGNARMNVQNALAAVGAAFAAGVYLHDIRQGLRTFTASYEFAPGRTNLIEVNGVQVIIDYCHNPAGMRLLGDFVARLAEQPTAQFTARRRIGVIGTAGDRRDEDMRELGAVAAEFFDHLIVREDDHGRGRKPGEAGALITEGIRSAGMRCRDSEVVQDEVEASRVALTRANPGDIVALCVEQAGPVWTEIQRMRDTIGAAAARTETPAPGA